MMRERSQVQGRPSSLVWKSQTNPNPNRRDVTYKMAR
jgi:hypothetical protein